MVAVGPERDTTVQPMKKPKVGPIKPLAGLPFSLRFSIYFPPIENKNIILKKIV